MRAHHLIVLSLGALLFICMYDRDVEVATHLPTHVPASLSVSPTATDMLDFDIVQWTCALEVVVRPTALDVPDVFDLTADDTLEPRDGDVGGPALACT
jgi:hypothetical protein